MRIYMLFEGRRYWPVWLSNYFIRREKKRLEHLDQILNDPHTSQRNYLEAGVEYALYPINEDGEASVVLPTRLGNILQAFETYSTVQYGLDGVFFWPRLWVVLDKDLRDEIDNSQALVDSTVYVSFALYVSGVLGAFYAAVEALPLRTWYVLHLVPNFQIPLDPGPFALALISFASVITAYAIYRVSLPAHAQFGELFKAVFDQYRSKVQFDDVLRDVTRISGDVRIIAESRQHRNMAIWRYLRWRLVRNELTGKT